MNELQVFESAEFGEVRVVEQNGEPWFVGRDVAEILGYKETAKAVREHVDAEDKGVSILDTPGGKQEITVINESGVYSLVFGSKMPRAKEFKRWVTSEVLPSIRKHGAYMTPETIEKVLFNPDSIIKIATQLKEEREKRQEAERLLEEAKPATVFAEAVSTSPKSILMRGLANFLKQNGVEIGQNRLFAWMRENGFLVKSGHDRNMPTQKAMELGLFQIKEGVVIGANGANVLTRTVKVTGKGQIYFVNKFLSRSEAG